MTPTTTESHKMKTDTLLAFRDAHPEAWPRALNYDGVKDWYMVGEGPDGMAKFQFVPERVAHALIGAKVMDAMGKEVDGISFDPPHGPDWVWVVNLDTVPAIKPCRGRTRLEALIEAYKAEMKGTTDGND